MDKEQMMTTELFLEIPGSDLRLINIVYLLASSDVFDRVAAVSAPWLM